VPSVTVCAGTEGPQHGGGGQPQDRGKGVHPEGSPAPVLSRTHLELAGAGCEVLAAIEGKARVSCDSVVV
jgi:hypothetical protein